MRTLDDIAAAIVAGEELSLGEVLRRAVRTNQLGFLENAIRDRLIERAIEARKIEAAAEEIARARALFFADHHLEDPRDAERWLGERAMTAKDLDRDLASIIRFGKLKEGIASDRVEPYFEQHRRDFDAVVISQIFASDHAGAVALRARLDRGEDFGALAREASIEARTKLHGGFAGKVRRGEAGVPSEVFDAPAGAVVGPLGTAIYRIERVLPAQLDHPTRSEIHSRLFSAWLDEERGRAGVEVRLTAILGLTSR